MPVGRRCPTNSSAGLNVNTPTLTAILGIVICILICSLAMPGFSEVEPASGIVPYHFSLPAEEVKHTITTWSQAVGYDLVPMGPDENCLRISRKNDGEALEMCITPDSPLASDVSFPQGKTSTIADELLLAIQTYADQSGHAVSGKHPVPEAVKKQIRNVVCIRAFGNNNEEDQFSGFVIGTDGLILTTAHGMKDASSLTVIFHDGRELKGRPVRWDPDIDLALIRVDVHGPHVVPVPKDKVPPSMGEPLYALGCPDNGGVVASCGMITEPPVKVNDLLLYQVNMPIHPGSSGSPVFDRNGQLSAVTRARFRGTDSIGFLIPLSTLNAFLESGEK